MNFYKRIISKMINNCRIGSIDLTFHDGDLISKINNDKLSKCDMSFLEFDGLKLIISEGSIGFARSTEFDSEDSEFFITLKEIPIYQGEYTPIGKVKYGLDIIKKIKTGNKAIYVLRPDYINTFRMLETN